jgi:hypothetical protein
MMYGSAPRSQRKGLPTLKIDNDKMAEFLNELKSHRLRKISNSADGSFDANADASTSSHASQSMINSHSSRDQSQLLQRPSALLHQRSMSQANDEQSNAALKRKRPVDVNRDGEYGRLHLSSP